MPTLNEVAKPIIFSEDVINELENPLYSHKMKIANRIIALRNEHSAQLKLLEQQIAQQQQRISTAKSNLDMFLARLDSCMDQESLKKLTRDFNL